MINNYDHYRVNWNNQNNNTKTVNNTQLHKSDAIAGNQQSVSQHSINYQSTSQQPTPRVKSFTNNFKENQHSVKTEVSNSTSDSLFPQFKEMKFLSSGIYGIVYRAKCRPNINKDFQNVIIKRNLYIKRDSSDGKMDFLSSVSLSEIDVLRKISSPVTSRILGIYTENNVNIVDNSSFDTKRLIKEELGTDSIPDQYLIVLSDFGDKFDRNKINISHWPLLFQQFLMAIHMLHSNNVIHRDIMINNILYYEVQGYPRLALIDYGLSTSFYSRYIYKSDLRYGHYYYRPPELYDENFIKYNHKIDVYMAGITLFNIITGTYPQIDFTTIYYDEGNGKKFKDVKPNDNTLASLKEELKQNSKSLNILWSACQDLLPLAYAHNVYYMISNMVSYYPEDRYDAIELINKYLNNTQDLVNQKLALQNKLNVRKPSNQINVTESLRSLPDISFLNDILRRTTTINEITPLILSEACDMLIRYLLYRSKTKHQSEICKELKKRFVFILYMSVKEQSEMSCDMPFEYMLKSFGDLIPQYSNIQQILQEYDNFEVYYITEVQHINNKRLWDNIEGFENSNAAKLKERIIEDYFGRIMTLSNDAIAVENKEIDPYQPTEMDVRPLDQQQLQ